MEPPAAARGGWDALLSDTDADAVGSSSPSSVAEAAGNDVAEPAAIVPAAVGGWGELLSDPEESSSASEEAQDEPMPMLLPPRKRGRPALPTSRRRLQSIRKQARQTLPLPLQGEAGRNVATRPWRMMRPVGAAELGRQLSSALSSETVRKGAGPYDILHKMSKAFMGPLPRQGLPMVAQAAVLSASRRTLSAHIMELACMVFFLARMAMASLFSWLLTMVHTEQIVVEACVSALQYDETPLRLRTSEARQAGRDDIKDGQETAIVKVLQAQAKFAVVVRGRATRGRRLMLTMEVPCALHCMDHGTAESMWACLKKNLEVEFFGDLRMVAKASYHISMADHGAANLRMERSLEHMLDHRCADAVPSFWF